MINSCCGDPSIIIQQHCFFCEDEQIEILVLNACKEKTIEDAKFCGRTKTHRQWKSNEFFEF
jgi:hypothetical protein